MTHNSEGTITKQDKHTEGVNELRSALRLVEVQLADQEDRWMALLAERDAELKKLRAARNALRDLLGEGGPIERSAPTPIKKVAGTSNQVREVARKAMEDEGKPLNRAEILSRLEVAGVHISARNPGKFIGKVMWRSPEFKHIGEGYWLTDRPLPEGVQ